MSFDEDREQYFPAARKGGNSDDAGLGGYGGINPSAPLPPDHSPGYETGSSVPFSPWGNSDNYAPSTPYQAGPVPGYAPPPPVVPRQGLTSPQGRRRRGVVLLFALAGVLLVGTLSALLLLHNGDNGQNSHGGGPGLAVATDTLVPTATLKPGETPLPTRVPTQVPATPVPGAPTATPIPYANSATVSFTAASQKIPNSQVPVRTTLTANTNGGDINATQKNVSVNVGDTQSPSVQADQTDFGSQDNGSLTIKNNNTITVNTPTGVPLTSQDGTVTCTTSFGGTTSPRLAPGATTTVVCTVPSFTNIPTAEAFNTTSGGFLYTGTLPPGGSAPVFTVPSNCASANIGAAHSAAQSSLQGKVAPPSGTTVFNGPNYNFADSGATCTPSAGTQRNNPFTYTASVAGTASITYYNNGDVQAFEAQQLQNAASAAAPAGSYQLLSAHNSICGGGGNISNANSTSVNISCPASGLIGWIWSSGSAHSTFDNLITGQPQQTAINTINATTQEVASGSVKISLVGGSFLPQSGSAITYNIKTP